MGVDYDAKFGIGVKVKINEDKLPDLSEFDDDILMYLYSLLEETNFKLIRYGNAYTSEYKYCIVLKKPLVEVGLNLQQYKDEIEKLLSHQEVFEKTSDFDVVGGFYLC